MVLEASDCNKHVGACSGNLEEVGGKAPDRMLRAPDGRPACKASSPMRSAVSGVCSADCVSRHTAGISTMHYPYITGTRSLVRP